MRLSAGEQLQPEDKDDAPVGMLVEGEDDSASSKPPPLEPSPEIVAQLTGMGFSENGSKRAAVAMQVPAHLRCILLCTVSGSGYMG